MQGGAPLQNKIRCFIPQIGVFKGAVIPLQAGLQALNNEADESLRLMQHPGTTSLCQLWPGSLFQNSV